MLKELKKDASVELSKIEKKEHKTTPPNRFTETSLIKELERLGIGRPSTFSSIVSIIQERGYVRKIKGQQLAPTFLGHAIVNLMKNKFTGFVDYGYTANMEEELDEISEGLKTRIAFLSNFWNGKSGFDATVKDLLANIDFEEIKGYSTIDLGNGFAIKYNKFGAFLEDSLGKADDKGFLPAVKIDELALAEDFLDVEHCRKLLKESVAAKVIADAGPLGVLTAGPYVGYEVTARTGKFGPYLVAEKDGKRVNQKMPKGKDLSTVTFADAEVLFGEVKLPRQLSDNFFTGIGKKGNYVGYKKTKATKKAVFKSLPEEYDPRTVTLEEVRAFWEEDSDKKS